jgi:hypothetical protein
MNTKLKEILEQFEFPYGMTDFTCIHCGEKILRPYYIKGNKPWKEWTEEMYVEYFMKHKCFKQ